MDIDVKRICKIIIDLIVFLFATTFILINLFLYFVGVITIIIIILD